MWNGDRKAVLATTSPPTGTHLEKVSSVRFGGIAAAQVTPVSATEVRARVPAGALTGPIAVSTPGGTTQSQGYFVVLPRPDFALAAAPGQGETLQGDSTVFSLAVRPTGGFTGMVRLTVSGLPSGLASTLDKPQLGPVGYANLTVTAGDRLTPGEYRFTVTGTSGINGKDVQRTIEATLRVYPAAGTSLSGQVRRLDGAPIPNYTIRAGAQRTRTDAGGNFLLRHLPPQGEVMLILDGRTAAVPGIAYPIYERRLYDGTLLRHRPNRLQEPAWVFAMDPRTAVPLDPGRETVLRFPHLPGLEIAIPAGTTLTDIDGQPVTSLYAVQVPLERPYFHSFLAGATPLALYSLQFGGTAASKPLQVTLPNVGNLPPGTRVPLRAYDVTRGGWYTPGQGTVTPDGTQIKPDPDVGITRLGCVYPAYGPQPKTPPPDGVTGGEPVDLATGLFLHEKTDLVLPGRVPFVFRRTYRSDTTHHGPFGYGGDHNFNLLLGSLPGTNNYELILPTDYRVILTNGVHTTTPAFYGATKVTTPGYPHSVKLKDGTILGFRMGDSYLVGQEDRHGNKFTIERADGLRVSKIRTPDGREVFFEYNSSYQITKITGPMDQAVQYAYDAADNLWKVTDPLGGVTEYTYDGSHNLLTIRDPQNIVFLTNEYSPGSKRVLKQTQADGGTWFFRYQLTGATVTGPGCPGSPPACPTEETYENAVPPGGAYTFTGGTVVATTVVDPRGKQTTYSFNAVGYTTQITRDPGGLNLITIINRDPATNFVTWVQDPLGRKTKFTYGDANKNLTQVKRYKDLANTQPVNWTFGYDPTYNLLTGYTDPLTHTWAFELDAAKKNVISVTNPLLKVWNIGRNGAGQVTSILPPGPANFATTFGYDPALGLLATITDPLSNVTTRTYDTLGRLVSQTDPRSYTTQFTYDPLNRLTGIADPLGHGVAFEYDPNGNLTKVSDPRGKSITYEYDSMDRVQKRTDALNQFETYTYELTGHLKTLTDRKNQVTTWTYDDLNRRSTVTYKKADGSTEATVTYGYDAVSRLRTLADSVNGTTIIDPDPLDRLTTETTPQGTVTYAYDDAGRRSTMTVAGQTPVTYGFDNGDRLLTVSKDTLQATYGYDDADRRTSLLLPNGVTTVYGYDNASRLTSLTYQGLVGGSQTLTYSYDAAGNRIATGGSWARTLLPDAITTASYDDNNRQLTFGSKTMTYDNNGNLTQLTDGPQTTNHTWNTRDQLTALSGFLTASFAYDALGRRASKTITGFTTTFQYDGWDIVREVLGGSTVTYLRGLEIDEPLARIEVSATTCYIGDSMDTSLALTDAGGNVTTSYTYEAFGRTTAPSGATQNALQYTGRENDSTGLYHYRARYYHPGLMRFISEDPIGLDGGDVNFYAYVGNDPISASDPLGLKTCPKPSKRRLDPNTYKKICDFAKRFYDEYSAVAGSGGFELDAIMTVSALESEWGTSPACNDARHNCFGQWAGQRPDGTGILGTYPNTRGGAEAFGQRWGPRLPGVRGARPQAGALQRPPKFNTVNACWLDAYVSIHNRVKQALADPACRPGKC